MLSGQLPVSSDSRAVRPPEIQDILERSTKKTKRSAETLESIDMDGVEVQASENQGRDHRIPVEQPAPMSYRNILTGVDEGQEMEKEDEVMASDDEEEDQEKDEDKECPRIRLMKEDKVRMRKPWRQSLIVKVMGKAVSYSYLLKRLNTLWQPKFKMDLLTMENNYFLVKFRSMTDYDYAKYGGPWMILDHYLIVKEWKPDFNPRTDKTEKVIVWVRLPDLPIEYYDRDFLFRVGNKIGKPITIDNATSLVSRGKFARLCVEVDITKPLLAKFLLKKEVRRIEYEGIHLVCFKCGIYGHSVESCPRNRPEGGSNPPLQPETSVDGGGTNVEAENGKLRDAIIEEEMRPEITSSFGPWMIAKRYNRKSTVNQTRKEGGNYGKNISGRNVHVNKGINESIQVGSRFSALNSFHETEENETFDLDVNAENVTTDPTDPGPICTSRGKGKRPVVEANEKQILGTNEAQRMGHRPENSRRNARQGLALRDGQLRGASHGNQGNKAGAALEHTVVRGEKHGEIIRSTIVSSQPDMHAMESIRFLMHSGDPPNDVADSSMLASEDVSNVRVVNNMLYVEENEEHGFEAMRS